MDTLLLVDDDDDIRETISIVLETEHYEVLEAADGVQALELLRAGHRPFLMIVDMMMPHLDGEGLILAMRADPRFADIPVVLLSGHYALSQKAAELNVPALGKPVELRRLLNLLQSYAPSAPPSRAQPRGAAATAPELSTPRGSS